ncbi:MAG: hypothetical protein U9Q81_01920 [Pseudomonadota bacterium]|nr:hypothetical protein [Pseudomonadota bacterium]
MTRTVRFHERTLEIHITKRAERALAGLGRPLVAEMELYFSCLIRKRVVFREGHAGPADHWVDEALGLRFRPVMTRNCSLGAAGGEPPVTDFPLVKPQRFVPRWLRIDYRGGAWQGEFGLSAQPAAAA